MNHGQVLGRSWKIFWQHKVLWLIGLIPYGVYFLSIIPFVLLAFLIFQGSVPEVLNQDWIWIAFLVFYVLLMLGYGVLMVWSKAASSLGILQVERGQEHVSFFELVNQGSPYFLRVLGLYGLYLAAILVVYLLLFGFISLVVAASFGMGLMCIFPFFFLLLPLFGVGYLLMEQSNAALFVEDLGVFEALKRGWEVLRKHFWQLVLMGIILYAGYYVLSMIISFPLYTLMMGPMMVPMITNDLESFFASFQFMLIGMSVFFFFSMLVTGVVTVYVRNIWMLTYLSLTHPPAQVVPVEPDNKKADA